MCGRESRRIYDRKLRWVRDLSAGDARIYLEIESRRVRCRSCAKVKQEKLASSPTTHQALRLLRGPALPSRDDPGRHPRVAAPGLERRSRISTSSICTNSSEGRERRRRGAWRSGSRPRVRQLLCGACRVSRRIDPDQCNPALICPTRKGQILQLDFFTATPVGCE
ncbi:MAG: transposase family protein [Candidatus Binataceae bacterium]